MKRAATLIFALNACLEFDKPELSGLVLQDIECFSDDMCKEMYGDDNECRVHVCNSTTLRCEIVAADRDGDDHIDNVCTTLNDNLGDDCNDLDDEINPDAEEFCDNRDNDCDRRVDEDLDCRISSDEICDGEDNDGNGYVDDFLYNPSSFIYDLGVGKPLAMAESGKRRDLLYIRNDALMRASYDSFWQRQGEVIMLEADANRLEFKDAFKKDGVDYALATYTTDAGAVLRWHKLDLGNYIESAPIAASDGALNVFEGGVVLAARERGSQTLKLFVFNDDGATLQATHLGDYEVRKLRITVCEDKLLVGILHSEDESYNLDYIVFGESLDREFSTRVVESDNWIREFEMVCPNDEDKFLLVTTEADREDTTISVDRIVMLYRLNGALTITDEAEIASFAHHRALSGNFNAHIVATNHSVVVAHGTPSKLKVRIFSFTLSPINLTLDITTEMPDGDHLLGKIDKSFSVIWPEDQRYATDPGSTFEVIYARNIVCVD